MVKPSPRRLDASRRRQQILDQALAVFARFGCAGTGTRQLAAAAGVTEPILYRHFAGKDALFAAVLAMVAARLETALAAVLQPYGEVRDRLQALAAALPKLLADHEDELRVLCGAAASHADAAQAAAARRALSGIGAVLTRAFTGAGLRRGVGAETAAFFLLEVGLGSALLRPVGVRAVLRPGFGARVVDLMTTALLPPARRG